MRISKKILLTFFFLFLVLAVGCHKVAAAEPIVGLAKSVSINDGNVENGDIICSDTNGYVSCKNEYDNAVVGVVNDSPAVSLENSEIARSHLMVSSGLSKVKVVNANGDIKTGDPIATSKIAGVGQKATRNAIVVGFAMEDFNESDKSKVGMIMASLEIHATTALSDNRVNLLYLLRQNLNPQMMGSLAFLRYLLALLIVLLSFVVGFIYFGRIAKTGIEAMGRNPMASRVIVFSIILHIMITIAIMAVGLALGYMILTL